MNSPIWLASFLLILVTPLCLAAPDQNLSANEIMHKAYVAGFYPAKDQSAQVTFTLLDSSGKTKEIKFHFYRKKSDYAYKTFIGMDEPAKVAGSSFMVWEKLYGIGDLWIYDPRLGHAIYVDPSYKHSHFAGSIFTYADISGRAFNVDHCQFLDDQSSGNQYVLKCMSQNGSQASFQYYIASVRKDNFIPIRLEYMDSNGQLVKLIEVEYIKNVQGYPTVMELLGKDLKAREETHIKFDHVQYNFGLADSLFTVEYMQHYTQQENKPNFEVSNNNGSSESTTYMQRYQEENSRPPSPLSLGR